MHIYVYACMYEYSVCMHVHMYICIHIHTHIILQYFWQFFDNNLVLEPVFCAISSIWGADKYRPLVIFVFSFEELSILSPNNLGEVSWAMNHSLEKEKLNIYFWFGRLIVCSHQIHFMTSCELYTIIFFKINNMLKLWGKL